MSFYTKDLPHILNDVDTTVGDYTYGPLQVGRLYGGCKLSIGKFCSLAAGIQVMFLGRHQTDDITTYPFCNLHGREWIPVQCSEVKGQDIKIGNDVWIATSATILQGADIGDGAVIGAYSVCKGKIPPYTIAVGNPCRVVKKRFSDEHIAKLLELQWWNWSIENINKYLHFISSPKVDELYEIWKAEIKG